MYGTRQWMLCVRVCARFSVLVYFLSSQQEKKRNTSNELSAPEHFEQR